MIAIIPLVVGAISVGLISVISQSSAVSKKVSDSRDATIVATNFIKDVQSASIVTTDPTITGPAPCGSSPPILSLLRGGTETSYAVVQQGTSSRYSLFRYSCQGTTLATALTSGQTGITSLSVPALLFAVASGDHLTIGAGSTSQAVTASSAAAIGATSISVVSFTSSSNQAAGTTVLDSSKLATPSDSAVVSHDVQSTLGALIGGQSCNPVSFSCTPSPSWSTAWWYADGISGVSITISATQSNYHYTLVGVPRISNGGSTGGASPGHAQFIGLSSSGTAICQGNGTVSITGTAAIDSSGPLPVASAKEAVRKSQRASCIPTRQLVPARFRGTSTWAGMEQCPREREYRQPTRTRA